MTIPELHARTIPAGGGSDDLASRWDMAREAYEAGERPDPDDLAAGDPWAIALQAVADHWSEVRFAVVMAALDGLERTERAVA